MTHEEDVVITRDGSLAQDSVVSLPTTKHSSHVLTDGDGERLAQCNLERSGRSKAVTCTQLICKCASVDKRLILQLHCVHMSSDK